MKKTVYATGLLMILMFSMFFTACTPQTPPTDIDDKEPITDIGKTDTGEFALRKFASEHDVQAFLKEQSQQQGRKMYMVESLDMFTAAPRAEGAVKRAGDGSATEYSQTNIQVEGVDEADFVKNDDKYIYVISGQTLTIIDAYPGENAKIIKTIVFKEQPRNLYVNKNKLVVFLEDHEERFIIPAYDFMPRPRSMPVTRVLIYDISNKKKPTKEKDFSFSGWYYESRMIGDHVYVVAKQSAYYYGGPVPLPVIRESGFRIIQPDIYYFNIIEPSYNFLTIGSVNVNSGEVEAKTFMTGESSTLYVSQNNIYIAHQKWNRYGYHGSHIEDRFYKVVVPLLPSDVQSKIKALKKDDSLTSAERWEKISKILEDMYNAMDVSQKKKLIKNIEEAVEEYELKQEAERRKTVIHKIALNRGDVEYKDRGIVHGHLLNQFSLDEFKNNLRVATTTFVYAGRDSTMYNNVYVLNDNMKVIGKLEDIAPEERIYSTRFIRNRLYMVTFKQVDPLFVIDLENPEKPEILGELKMPGFSDYLHPYDENHLIGFGKETSVSEAGAVTVEGVKLSLFDVEDVENPKQIDTFIIGERGSQSEVLRDHKALLFDKEKNLLVIPIREVKGRIFDKQREYYRNKIWEGAYVLGVTPDEGFTKKATITHTEKEDDPYRWYSPDAIKRSLYLDDYLYTISLKKVMVNEMSRWEEVKTIELDLKDEDMYPKPIPFRGIVDEVVEITMPSVAVDAEIEE